MLDEETDVPEVSTAPVIPVSFRDSRTGRLLWDVASRRLEDDERLVAWTRAWISRDGRFNVVFAARHLDYVVLTDRRLMLFNCGFFTRRPRRRVLTDRLAHTTVDDIGSQPLRRLRIRAFARRALRFDFNNGEASHEVASTLLRPQTD